MNARMKKNILLVLFTFISFGTQQAPAMIGIAKVTIKVIDDEQRPIQGADIGIGFQYDKSWATESTSIKGVTDSNGRFKASASTNGHIGARVSKDGYYNSRVIYDFEESGLFGWEPWDPELTVVLRKIEDPVPMYARDAKVQFPVDDTDIGFDLIAFDWIYPYGRGTYIDFLFNVNVIDNGGNDFEYNIDIKFPNSLDGLIKYEEDVRHGSVFKLPRKAPIEGYKNEHKVFLKGVKRGAKVSWKENCHYIFRIRSEEEDGKLKRGMYGKIISDIKIISTKKGEMPSIKFKYYLNPYYTRNLEFDPKRNLFGSLPEFEQVGIK